MRWRKRDRILLHWLWKMADDYAIITCVMALWEIVESEDFKSVVRDYRQTCLWFANDVYHPRDEIQLEQILSAIESHGDMAAFKRVGRIRKWLSPDFSPRYSNSLPVRA